MRTSFLTTVAAAAALTYPLAAAGHHSFAAVFDREKPVEVTGTVTEVEWMNPHVWIYLDVNKGGGEVEKWGFELGSPNGLIRRGWNHQSLRVGQVVAVIGVRARDGSLTGAVRTVTLPTGESMFGAQNESR